MSRLTRLNMQQGLLANSHHKCGSNPQQGQLLEGKEGQGLTWDVSNLTWRSHGLSVHSGAHLGVRGMWQKEP